MDQEQLITQFNKVIDKRTRDKEAFISRLLIEFSLNPSLVRKRSNSIFFNKCLRKKENSRARLYQKNRRKVEAFMTKFSKKSQQVMLAHP
jgi:hypothetical protein